MSTNKLTDQEKLKQIEKEVGKKVVDELKAEYREEKKNEQNITYTKEKESRNKSSVVNPNQLQVQKYPDDTEFIKLLESITKDYEMMENFVKSSSGSKLAPKIKDGLTTIISSGNEITKINQTYSRKPQIIKFNETMKNSYKEYNSILKVINETLVKLEKAGWCSKGSLNSTLLKHIDLATGFICLHKVIAGLESREIMLSSGEIIIEKIVEVEPSEARIRELIAKNIKDFIPKEKPPQTIVEYKPEVKYVPQDDLLGKAYQLLYGQKNYFEALKLLRDLDAKDDHNAQCTIGLMYLDGLGIQKNIKKATEYFQKAAAKNNLEAIYRLGVLLEKGFYKESEDLKSNQRQAVDNYRKAAAGGHPDATTDLAYLYEYGIIVNRDVNEALALLTKAADKKNPRALCNLGIMYFNNVVKTTKMSNDQKAFDCFQQAAEQGYLKAYANLGICYEKGRGTNQDINKAVEYYTMAAEKGDVESIFHLAYINLDQASRNDDIDKYFEAATKFRDVTTKDPDNGDAYYYLGFMYEHGLGTDKDLKTAYKYYEKAGSLKCTKALNKQGHFLAKGVGVDEPNSQLSLKCYERAAELGDYDALNHLGVIYEEGIDVNIDYKKALNYYKKGSDLGDAKSKFNYGLMLERGRAGEIKFDEAVKYYKESAESGYVAAQMMLSQRELDEKWQTEISGLLSTILEKSGKNKTTDDINRSNDEIDRLPNLAKYSSDPVNQVTNKFTSGSISQKIPLTKSIMTTKDGRELNSKISEVYNDDDDDKSFPK